MQSCRCPEPPMNLTTFLAKWDRHSPERTDQPDGKIDVYVDGIVDHKHAEFCRDFLALGPDKTPDEKGEISYSWQQELLSHKIFTESAQRLVPADHP